MSHPTTPPTPLFGQYLGAAAAASRAAIDKVLADAGTTFPHWLVLNALAIGAAGVVLDDAAVDDHLAAGLVTRTPEGLALTDAGEARYAELRAAVQGLSAQLVAGTPPEDMETVRRVLATLTERAQALVAADGAAT
ncbi:MAG TPA: MarR family winged helix-turn-helix transcriptional regulator [Acidimicrobiales bacterium]|nr:MarR family winged helix-turn-helix transcriptional regulator [Acidimicrobiales bacterium]